VRLLTTEARLVPLSPADVSPEYYISAENIARSVQVWQLPRHVGSIGMNVPDGHGYYVLLSRSGGPDEDGVVSVATSAVRYTSSAIAHQSFTAVATMGGTEGIAFLEVPGLADEERWWRSEGAIVVVEQALARRHNFLLSLTIVRVPAPATGNVASKYMRLLQGKLSE
jgi:hypothetical protein